LTGFRRAFHWAFSRFGTTLIAMLAVPEQTAVFLMESGGLHATPAWHLFRVHSDGIDRGLRDKTRKPRPFDMDTGHRRRGMNRVGP
jgi:hypothetical protein